MKVSLLDIINSASALKELFALKFDPRTAFKNSKLLAAVQNELNSYNDVYSKLLEKHGDLLETNDEEKKYTFNEKNRKKLNKELKDLQSLEIELEFEKIPLSKIESNMSSSDMYSLRWLILED